ncbi:hypothetical protein, partial [Klebsiella pneumoniae]|uniref:hypothetical protein n=1 Tax=Klebsiella pneumoniae TaxID=573 RepID=UPI0027304ED3
PKLFSRSSNDAGAVAYRNSGPDENVLRAIGDQVKPAMRPIPGMVMVRDDWGPRVPRMNVQIDQAKALALGISS